MKTVNLNTSHSFGIFWLLFFFFIQQHIMGSYWDGVRVYTYSRLMLTLAHHMELHTFGKRACVVEFMKVICAYNATPLYFLYNSGYLQ
jgi:hypothetical protein